MFACRKCRVRQKVAKNGRICDGCRTGGLSPEGIVAKRLGVRRSTLMLAGGPQAAATLDPSTLAVLLKSLPKTGRGRSLVSRGMTAQRPCVIAFKPQKTEWPVDRMAVAEKMVAYEAKF